uniref:H15 domain-containing protein n=1 Tax=Oryza brachyantha TaxID=4533 RepID=J3MAF5_ORYBR
MVVAVASPSSSPGAAGRPHPTYKEMILQALAELQDPIRSSRRAIAKYISENFSGLPSRHDALLSVHLRRLRSQGLLLMSGHSYLLSTSASGSAPQQRRGRGRPPKKAPPAPAKRGPGRPRQNTSASALFPVPVLEAKPGRPRKKPLPVAFSAAEPLGVGAKRGPGRPRKSAASPVAPPPASRPKRGVGRPRKNATPMAPLVLKPGPGKPSGFKRGPGRPPKNAIPVVPTAVLGVKRGRGRPPKNVPILSTAPGAKLPTGKPQLGRPRKVVVTIAVKRGPGRPRKIAAVESSSDNAVVNTSVPAARRGRGRPPKAKLPAHGGIASSAVPSLIAQERKHGQTYKKRRMPGRPRKDKPLQSGIVLSGDDALTKRGPGRPRKKRPLEAAGVVAAEVEASPTEDGVEAGAVQNGGVVGKRGRGRPKREKPSSARPAETGDAKSMGIKRGRGRPRKDSSFQAVFAGIASEVSRNVTEARPEGDADLLSGKQSETAAVVSGESKETRPADAGVVVVSGEKTSIDPVEAGSVMSCVEAGVDRVDSNLGTANL